VTPRPDHGSNLFAPSIVADRHAGHAAVNGQVGVGIEVSVLFIYNG